MRLRLGLIGLSNDWSQCHLPALKVLQERFDVRGVYSSVSSLSEKAAREFSAKRFDGFREMLSSDEIDAAMMLEGDWYGTTPIQAACDFGKAIYCGREVDFAPEQAAQLKNAVDRSGIAFMAEFPRRYAPASLRLKELIATRLGRPKILFCHRRFSADANQSARSGASLRSRTDRELVELIDWCSFIVGQPAARVQAISHMSAKTKEPDYQVLSVDLSNANEEAGSTIAQISCGSYIPATWTEAITCRPPAALQVCCENGVAFLDLPNTLIWFDNSGRHQESLESEMAVGQQLLTQFHRAVTSLVRKMGDLQDVYLALRALQTARESSVQGRILPIEV